VTLQLAGAPANPTFALTYDRAAQRYLGTVRAPDPGRYFLKATAYRQGTVRGEDQKLLVSQHADRESLRVPANPGLLADLSRFSGGVVADPNEPSALQSILEKTALPATVEYRRKPLWDNAWILSAIVILLAAEWVLRRLRGLA
jgi:hypothetical protein